VIVNICCRQLETANCSVLEENRGCLFVGNTKRINSIEVHEAIAFNRRIYFSTDDEMKLS
jgi:hypothetical protein